MTAVRSSDLSVVIPTYQRRGRTLRAVESVLGGQLQPVELVVVDDGSTDGTAEAVSELDRRARVVRHSANRGVAAARNTGIAQTTGKWVVLLDSDDQWLPDHLEKIATFVATNRECRIVQTLERWYRGGLRVNQKNVHRPSSGDIFEPSLQRCVVSSSAVAFERKLFEAEGGYDERLPACEDYDLWLRLARHTSFGLIDSETVVKDGGRADQLSRRIWGLDRFRVFSLAKLLAGNPDSGLNKGQFASVRKICLSKLAVLEAGAARRGKETAAAAYRRWTQAVEAIEPSSSQNTKKGLSELLSLLAEADDSSGRPTGDPILDGLRPWATLDSAELNETERSR